MSFSSSMDTITAFLSRSSYYVSLLGLKIPLALLLRASTARYVLACILLGYTPFSVYCHLSLMPSVSSSDNGILIWHVLTAIWVTIPLLVVGAVIISHVRQREPVALFCAGLTCVLCFHRFAIPVLQPTIFGTALLQAFFLFFEDGSTLGWIWCLYYVVKLQNFVIENKEKGICPMEESQGPHDRALIVGNAPTVMTGPPLGAQVDDFSSVVRFNSYTVGVPEYTGSKVSYHYCNGRELPSTSSTRAVLPIFNASLTHAVYLFMPHMEDARETCANLMTSKASVWFVEEERILALREKIGCLVWQIPSSGMVAIDAFLSKHENVTLHGFNFFSGDKIHYFEESALQLLTSWLERFVTHNPPKEKLWVQSLIKEGRATFLDPASAPLQAAKPEEVETDKSEMSPNTEKEKKFAEDGEARRRNPGLLRTLIKDGMPSQFSL